MVAATLNTEALSRVILCDPTICPWNSPGKNTGVGCHSLLQGIFLTQGWNLGQLHFRQIFFYCLSYQGTVLGVTKSRI